MTTIYCPAKINLYLAILGRDLSGYHEIDTIYVRHDALQDEIEIEPASALKIEFFPREGIEPENNTVLTALRLLEQKTGRPFAYKITIHKNIPLRSGLGGASSDAASLFLHLNEVEALGLSREELMQLGTQIGMDLPFFLSGYQVARGTHYGERISELPPLPKNLHLEVGFTGVEVSTKVAFAEWDRRGLCSDAPKWKTIETLHNDFEQIFPDLSFKGPHTVLTGSGGAYSMVYNNLIPVNSSLAFLVEHE